LFTYDNENIAWKAIPIAWLVAATAFLAVNWIFNPSYLGISSTFLFPYFASIVLGPDVLIDPSTTTLIIGGVVHYLLALVFTFIIAIVIHRWGFLIGLIGGGLLGLAFYAINFYTMTLFFDWMFAIHNPVLVTSHVVFGAVAGGIYELLDDYDTSIIDGEVNK